MLNSVNLRIDLYYYYFDSIFLEKLLCIIRVYLRMKYKHKYIQNQYQRLTGKCYPSQAQLFRRAKIYFSFLIILFSIVLLKNKDTLINY